MKISILVDKRIYVGEVFPVNPSNDYSELLTNHSIPDDDVSEISVIFDDVHYLGVNARDVCIKLVDDTSPPPLDLDRKSHTITRTYDKDTESYEWRNEYGQLHQEGDLPAIVDKDGSLMWYRNGLVHRDNGPAVVTVDGKKWYKNGVLHRNNGPALINITDKTQKWYKNGVLHRDGDEPAVVESNKRRWYKNGLLHRDGDRPAFMTDTVHEWYKNGKLHREDGPASVSFDTGIKRWYEFGKLHRSDGPAIHDPLDKQTEWWYRGEKLDDYTDVPELE